jgi:glutamyl/glutaminyl-tRNA synthetase
MPSSSVRVRFAPSPTGFFHIGSARTALFNWLYARHTGGAFVLRIEDTDKERDSEEFLNIIYDSLTWLGLNWDEGPRIGGDFGPYRQSERDGIYREYLQKLVVAGRAYEKDGATWFKLLGDRSEVYDDHRKKTVTKVANQPAVIDDRIRGRVERLEDEDFVIVRSDGSPVFHFVNVVDDIAMRITHVIRGEDHLSNTSKHVELFKAFGAPVPQYAHIPLILKDPRLGKGKMSKRDKGALVAEYQDRAFVPEALVNFLSLLGWNPGDDREKLPRDEIVRLFDFPGVNQSNARFDEQKLMHMNAQYLWELPAERYLAMARDFFTRQKVFPGGWPDESYWRDVVLLAQPKVKGIADLPAYTGYFFAEDYATDAKAAAKIMGKGDPRTRLCELLELVRTADFSSEAALETALTALAAQHGLGIGDYVHAGRLAVSGTNVGPGFFALYRVLGRDRVARRLERFLAQPG